MKPSKYIDRERLNIIESLKNNDSPVLSGQAMRSLKKLNTNLMKIHNVITCGLLACLLLTSCELNLLDPRNDNQQELSRVLRDPVYAEGILHSAYKHLPTNYTFSEVATDDAVTNQKSNPFLRMATGEWSRFYNPVSEWNSAYAAIFNLNFLLSIVNDVEWSWQSPNRNALFIQKNSGEAYALRGYFYLQLLQAHGGVASDGRLLGVQLVTEPIGTKDNWKLERATFQEVLNRINADFDSALVKLPYIWISSYSNDDSIRVFGVQNLGRIQGKIVKALKSKAALLAASPAYNGGIYSESMAATAAELAAPLLIERGGVSGLPPDAIFWDADVDASNPDILWRNDFVTNNTRERSNYPPSLWGNGNVNPTQNLVDAFPMRNGYPIGHASSGFNPANPYNLRDTRLAANIIFNGSVLRAQTIITSPESPNPAIPNINGLNITEFSTRTGYYLKKLLRVDVNLDPAATNTRRHFYTHIRFTELFLNYAEAANEAWGPDNDPNGYGFTARSVIQRIRLRASITQPDAYLATITSKEQMRELIRNERRLELCFEGHRFWDIRRWGLNNTITEAARGVSIVDGVYNPINVENRSYQLPAALYGPIPNEEILKNNLILQNTGW
jgi:starch-binding outer membrane protein, SusD/RagB family